MEDEHILKLSFKALSAIKQKGGRGETSEIWEMTGNYTWLQMLILQEFSRAG